MKVALTGNIGSGKSKVCNYLKQKGYPVLSADLVAREVVKPGSDALNSIEEVFGKDILCKDGSLNRAKLATIVFGNKEKKQRLETILHPKILRMLLEKMQGKKLVFAEIPLLYEVNWQNHFDLVILVVTEDRIRLERIMKRDKLTEKQVLARMDSQMPQDQKIGLADYVLDNTGDFAKTVLNIDTILKDIGGKYEKNKGGTCGSRSHETAND